MATKKEFEITDVLPKMGTPEMTVYRTIEWDHKPDVSHMPFNVPTEMYFGVDRNALGDVFSDNEINPAIFDDAYKNMMGRLGKCTYELFRMEVLRHFLIYGYEPSFRIHDVCCEWSFESWEVRDGVLEALFRSQYKRLSEPASSNKSVTGWD